MLEALGIRLNHQDAVCDRTHIYIDGTPIARRPGGLSDPHWDIVCRFVCGHAPTRDFLVFYPPEPDDTAVWTRLDAYMAPVDAYIMGERSKSSSRFRKKY